MERNLAMEYVVFSTPFWTLDFVLTIHVGPRRHFVMSLEYVGYVGIVAVLQNNCITRCPFTGLCVQQRI